MEDLLLTLLGLITGKVRTPHRNFWEVRSIRDKSSMACVHGSDRNCTGLQQCMQPPGQLLPT